MKFINGYENLYSITEDGKVFSNLSNKFMKPGHNGVGYAKVALRKDGEYHKHYVHRLVAQTYIPNPENLPFVNHKDENPANNCVENLEWCTVLYNNNYGTCRQRGAITKGTPVFCIELNRCFNSSREAERELSIFHSCINDCCKGKAHTAGGYHWKYV